MNPRVPAEHLVAAMAERLLPHLDAAHNLARWLVRNDHDAEDVVQEAFMRAFRYGPGAGVQDVRPWLLAIVRNTSRACLRKRRGDERLRPIEGDVQSVDPPPDPEQQALQRADARAVGAALADLPPAFREALLLREVEGLSYKEMAGVLGVPIGTVMSTLSRARARLRLTLRTAVAG